MNERYMLVAFTTGRLFYNLLISNNLTQAMSFQDQKLLKVGFYKYSDG